MSLALESVGIGQNEANFPVCKCAREEDIGGRNPQLSVRLPKCPRMKSLMLSSR